jgi:ABC-type multidrug transport system fused ATPase/permease subunit
MTSVERVIEYIDLRPEEFPTKSNSIALSAHWPIGSITFDNLSFRYSPDSPWVLDKINVSIRQGEKVKTTNTKPYQFPILSFTDWDRR